MHLLTATFFRGFNNDDRWGHRAGEPQKAVICSLALARLRTDIRGSEGVANSNAVGMAQKLLLFWRKPARRCWWEGVELDNVEGIQGTLKVWIRRVWTLEMVCFLTWPKKNQGQRLTTENFSECHRITMNHNMHPSWGHIGVCRLIGRWRHYTLPASGFE